MSTQPHPKIITILGATGTQGTSVVDTFASLPAWSIRAITRNKLSPQAQALRARHPAIDIVEADANDPSSLRTAFSGATVIFAVTDYWAPFNDPVLREKYGTGDALRRYAYDEEIRLGRNIVDAASDVLEEQGVLERFIWSSLPSPTVGSGGKYQKIYHFESKAVIEGYVRRERERLASRMSVLFVGFYVSNLLVMGLMRPVKRLDGSFLIQRLCPSHSKHPFILTRSDTGPFVKTLIDQPPGTKLLAYTAMLSWGELTQLWGKTLNQRVEFRTVSLEEFREKYPVDGEEVLSANYSAEFGYVGGDEMVVGPRDVGMQERVGDVERWIGEQDWGVVLEGQVDGTV